MVNYQPSSSVLSMVSTDLVGQIACRDICHTCMCIVTLSAIYHSFVLHPSCIIHKMVVGILWYCLAHIAMKARAGHQMCHPSECSCMVLTVNGWLSQPRVTSQGRGGGGVSGRGRGQGRGGGSFIPRDLGRRVFVANLWVSSFIRQCTTLRDSLPLCATVDHFFMQTRLEAVKELGATLCMSDDGTKHSSP